MPGHCGQVKYEYRQWRGFKLALAGHEAERARREEAFPAVREHTNYHSGQHQIWKTDNCKEAFSNSQKLPKNNRHEDEHLSAFQTFSRIKTIPALAENMFTLIRPGYKE